MVKKTIIITITIVVALIVVAAVVVPTTIVLLNNKNNNDVKDTSSSTSEASTTDSPTTFTSTTTSGDPSSTTTTGSPTASTTSTTEKPTTSSSTTTSSTTGTPTPTPNPNPTGPAYTIKNIQFVQTHVLPPKGLKWTTPDNRTTVLHLVGNRDTMVLVEFKEKIVSDFRPLLHVWNPSAQNPSSLDLGTTIYCNLPFEMPPTESKGPKFGENLYSARIPAQYITQGFEVTFENDKKNSTVPVAPVVGFASTAILYNLPFYMFGADDTNSVPFSQVKAEKAANVPFIYQQWPVSKLIHANHPMGKIVFNTVIHHIDGADAYKITSLDNIVENDQFKLMGLVLDFIDRIVTANGDSDSNIITWAPLLSLHSNGQYEEVGGGLGGGLKGTGAAQSDGVMIHEVGHAQGLPHAGEAYTDGSYPYAKGSVDGSAWGFNFNTNEFLGLYIPSNSTEYEACKEEDRVIYNGRCIKQDPMQGGAGCQSIGYPYTMYADYSAGRIQSLYEGSTTVVKGAHVISGIRTYLPDTKSFVQWDSIDQKVVPLKIINESYGIYGMDMGAPSVRNVPVYTIMIQYINAPTSSCTGCSVIYPPSPKWTGNLVRHIDPTDATQLAELNIDSGNLRWFCAGSGCDYTMRVTYNDGSKYTKLFQKGVRAFYDMAGAAEPQYTDPKKSASTYLFVENVPGNKPITLVELLWTPMGYASPTPSNAQVLISRSF
ncbi:hypothetical protein SAMD00019534_106250 [Acytostelium subglobosum LB1]|uniref:hypothetical protein n=1 Tax=Acytostelium subglobosum LB1 TaxID=1410327 RepID=UPI0006451BDF|nr:hypothetical protein SAMD00019534_106250 [Acytostelium subglobosum LB1]GAM27449.1 hypothetical protein SAMD00019534_106250 [Acytostelium subglobosum LB1]|eukprot:XP_012749514.1 hypothetical protein SAMD00019534_106250 [Acytostelium subglobosum LB1]